MNILNLNNEKNFKALTATVVSMSIDKFVYKSPNIRNTAILGIVAGSANYLASTLQENNMIPTIAIAEVYNSDSINIKTIELRIVEISLSGLGAYTVNNQILKNMRPNLSIQNCLILFVAPSFVAEYITDYFFNQKLSYLA